VASQGFTFRIFYDNLDEILGVFLEFGSKVLGTWQQNAPLIKDSLIHTRFLKIKFNEVSMKLKNKI
jgi:hypothetical protein